MEKAVERNLRERIDRAVEPMIEVMEKLDALNRGLARRRTR
jgi:hypothetical protein